ncbi:MAG: hypothetical protein BMS9Abin10_0945 [Gammaproteobacteria bacterium]|nr:MAG: hypothetical protein BMS9Abin10_0945 [Gammaproteobacteria bacterium]
MGIALFLGACATGGGDSSGIERHLAAQKPERALKTLEKQSRQWARRDQVLYLLNKAMLLRMQGQLAASSDTFEQAKQRIDKLYGVSVSEQIGSVIINDRTRQYVGEEFEQVLVNVYEALNYLELEQPDAARVEALQIDLKLREFSKKIAKKKYTEDAFARYLAGMIYEGQGEWSDALIEYRNAYEAYGEYQKEYGVAVPRSLKRSLLRLSERVGLSAEMERYEAEFDIDRGEIAEARGEQGELIYVLSNGLAPVKRENAIFVLAPQAATMVKVSLPYYESRVTSAVTARIKVDGKVVPMEEVEDVSAIAIRSLKSKMPAIRARAIARASIKGAVAYQLKRQDQWLLGLLAEFGGLATERADTRSWVTLPSNIFLARIPLAPGAYKVQLELLDSRSAVIAKREFRDIIVNKGQMTFLSYHWIDSQNLYFR